MEDWGFEDYDSIDDENTDFGLPEGEKTTMRQMTFNLTEEQAQNVEEAIDHTKEKGYDKNMEGGSDNRNGNSLHYIVVNWDRQKK